MDVTDVSRLPEALEDAQIAIAFATAKQPLMRFSDIRLPDLLVRRADQIAVRLIPAWARQLDSAKDGRSRNLIRTIRAFTNCNFSAKHTARELGVHTNTIYFRLNRLQKISGMDPRTYAGASTILTALSLLEIHNDESALALQRDGGPSDAR